MLQKILVPVDYSDHSQQALDQAIELAQLAQAEIQLLHTLSPSDQAYPIQLGHPVSHIGINSAFSQEVVELYAQQLQQFVQDHLNRLQSLVKVVESKGLLVTGTQHFGDAGTDICQTAAEWQAALIVIGRRGHTGLKEAVLGSVSNYVMHHAPCSVMIVQEKNSLTKESIKPQAMSAI
jgi:nucleotide-binding universal stress UspA family protein